MPDLTEKLIELLRWFIAEDDTQDILNNGPWVIGLERARKALADYDGEEYEPLIWNNQHPEVIAELEKICQT